MIPVAVIREIVAAFRDAAVKVAGWRVELDRVMLRVRAITGRDCPELRTAAIGAARRMDVPPHAVAGWMVDMLAVGVPAEQVRELCDQDRYAWDVYGQTITPPWDRA